MHYSIENEYMVRTPVLPEKVFNRTFITSDNDSLARLIELSRNSIVRETILIGSPSLYKSLSGLKYEEKTGKKFRHTIESLSHFINRMTSRATPYGLFSAVSFESSSQEMAGVNSQLHKRVRVDFEWLSAIYSLLEKDKAVLSNLSIRWNPLAIDRGDRIVLQYKTGWGRKEPLDGIQQSFIKKLPIVGQVMLSCQENINFQDLLDSLSQKFAQFDIKQIFNVLRELIENEFLLTDIHPTIVNSDDFGQLIKRLARIPETSLLLNRLQHIQILINQYEKTSLGEGIELYQNIVKQMGSVAKASTYLKVDLLSTKSGGKAPKLSEIDDAMNCVASMTPSQNRFPEITAFLKTFIEKYGEDRMVPLIEVLEPEQGCGSPYSKQLKDVDFRDSREEKMATHQLISKVEEAILQGSKIIDLKKVIPAEYHASFSKGFEVFTAQCSNPITGEEEYRILPNTGSDQNGKAAGRFKIRADRIEKSKSDTLSVELVELFRNRHFLNVAQNVDNNKFETAIGTITSSSKSEICLGDILVGVEWVNDKQRFFFESQKSGKRLKFYVTSMINYENSRIFSNIGRFLLEVSMYQIDNPFFIPNLMNSAYQYPYLPELKCGPVIVSARRWNLNQNTLNRAVKSDIKSAVFDFIERWKVSKLVYLERGDTRLLIDLDNDYQLEEVVISISKFGFACLSEYLPSYDGLAREYVFSFVPDKMEANHGARVTADLTRERISTVSPVRTFIPGDEWFFCKIYGVGSRILEIIKRDLFYFTKLLQSKQLISEHHYLIYKDSGGVHIRIRYKVATGIQPSVLFALVNEWGHTLIQRGSINRIVYDTYQREIERYGGKALMPKIEGVFTIDSEVTTSILQKITSSSSESSLLQKMLTIVDYLGFLGLSVEQQTVLMSPFDNRVNQKAFVQLRKAIHKETEELVKDIIVRSHVADKSKYVPNLYINYMDKKVRLGNNVEDNVYLSLVHMHCNRLLINRGDEEKVMYLLGHLLSKTELFLLKGV